MRTTIPNVWQVPRSSKAMMMDTHQIVGPPQKCLFGAITKMVTLVGLVLLQLLCLPVLPAEARQLHWSLPDGNSPRVTIPQGTFVGTSVTSSDSLPDIEEFLGIPYAQPPIGAQRYSPPLDVGTSDATFNASTYGHPCIQVIPADDEDEDCLNVNIFRPSGTSEGQNLPVVVYIHGGAFAAGSGASRGIGRMVAASLAPIIGVSINYRLGALGFLSSGVTARAGALNLGLIDQQHALKWVQANIVGFGGASTKITIMGDSAGAHSVGHHLQSPLSAGLFQQVIMESGAATAHLCQPYDSSRTAEQFQAFMSLVAIDPSQPDDAVMAALRALPVATIKQASTTVWNTYSSSNAWAFQAVIDGPGGIIPSAPVDLWTSGNWNKVPVLTGFCTDEGAPFVPASISTSQQFTDFFTTLNPVWSPDVISSINNLYPDPLTDSSSPYPSEYSRITAAYGQFAYIAPVRHSAHFAGGSNLPVYLYHFQLNSSVVEGTGHACAGGYVAYDSGIVNISPSQKSLAQAVNAFWTSFVANGDPNVAARSGVAAWPRYAEGATTSNKMVFGAGNDERAGGTHVGVLTQSVVETKFVKESQFWWSITKQSES